MQDDNPYAPPAWETDGNWSELDIPTTAAWRDGRQLVLPAQAVALPEGCAICGAAPSVGRTATIAEPLTGLILSGHVTFFTILMASVVWMIQTDDDSPAWAVVVFAIVGWLVFGAVLRIRTARSIPLTFGLCSVHNRRDWILSGARWILILLLLFRHQVTWLTILGSNLLFPIICLGLLTTNLGRVGVHARRTRTRELRVKGLGKAYLAQFSATPADKGASV